MRVCCVRNSGSLHRLHQVCTRPESRNPPTLHRWPRPLLTRTRQPPQWAPECPPRTWRPPRCPSRTSQTQAECWRGTWPVSRWCVTSHSKWQGRGLRVEGGVCELVTTGTTEKQVQRKVNVSGVKRCLIYTVCWCSHCSIVVVGVSLHKLALVHMLYRDRHKQTSVPHQTPNSQFREHHKACLYNVKSKALLKYNKLNLIYKHKQLYTDTMFNVFAPIKKNIYLIRHLNLSHSTSETTTKIL